MLMFTLHPTNYSSQNNVNLYSNLIWTERYLDAGEFELRSPAIEETRALLPEDTLVGIKESREVMIVKTHEIEPNDEGVSEIVVKGRSFETVLDDRFLFAGPYKEAWLHPQVVNSIRMSASLAWNAVCNATGADKLALTFMASDDRDVIPNVSISFTNEGVGETPEEWYLENGPVYSRIIDFLTKSGGGIRNIRPPYVTPIEGTEFTLGEGAEMTAIIGGIPSALKIDFYKGLDRTINQTVRNQVALHYRAGHLDKPKYLFSTQNLKTTGWVYSSEGGAVIGDAGPLTGRQRKMLYVDGGDFGTDVPDDWLAQITQKGQIELAKYNRQQLVSTGVSMSAPYQYGVDYGLGDKVTILGEFGYQGTMMVNEYIRTDNGEQDQGWPTLILAN